MSESPGSSLTLVSWNLVRSHTFNHQQQLTPLFRGKTRYRSHVTGGSVESTSEENCQVDGGALEHLHAPLYFLTDTKNHDYLSYYSDWRMCKRLVGGRRGGGTNKCSGLIFGHSDALAQGHGVLFPLFRLFTFKASLVSLSDLSRHAIVCDRFRLCGLKPSDSPPC